ncbi:DUF1643 domain-containing protein [Phaeacidiphilus oryzae]|uniref:DUF1643 domain-containing protein n=1 Tax=Phaeacidiphilus oryzae TaxID=348818 RepID=UPI00056D7E79|nr:DUF1643 domain-containing protein [Phaeacidiphilus oryzae]
MTTRPAPGLSRAAVISPCGRYRYELRRCWAGGPNATWIMLNPSTADAERDDPTIRRVCGFSRALGCGAATVLNLYAWRATRPAELWQTDDPVGPDNDAHLAHAAEESARTGGPLIAAWGAGARPNRIGQVLDLPGMHRLTALATTRAGQPRHPLYLPAGLTPSPLES